MNDAQIICQLLEKMLEVALLEQPYPGQTNRTNFFPDIEFVKDRQEIFVSNQYLENDCQVNVSGYSVSVFSQDEIESMATGQGNLPYFSIIDASIELDKATISLQLSWATSEENKKAGVYFLGGGGVRVIFSNVGGEWQAPSGQISTWST